MNNKLFKIKNKIYIFFKNKDIFSINFFIISFGILFFLFLKINILFSFYFTVSLIGLMYVMKRVKHTMAKQYLYVSFIYFIVSIILIKINFAGILGYQDQYFYIEESVNLLSKSEEYGNIVNSFLFATHQFNFNNWSFIHYINDYIFQNTQAILFFNFNFYFIVIVYTWKTFKHIFISEKVRFYFFTFMLFSFPILFINSLYLKESFYSSLLLLLFSSLKNKNIFLIALSSFFLVKIRLSYFILIILIALFFRIIFSVKKRMKIIIFSVIIGIGIIGINYISTLGNTGIKLIDYFNQSSSGGSVAKVEKLQNFSMKFIDKENLLSIQNIIVIPVAGLFSPPAIRFLKVRDLRTIIESLMVSMWWWIGLPYFFIFILELVKKDYKLSSYVLGIFLSIYLASSFSLITIAPEIFRYRLSLFGLFLLGIFIGTYWYKDNKRLLYKRIIKLWFYGSGSLYLLYLIK